jgi:hypothetical protein
MHIERVFRVINLLDIPEAKRKFWPQKAAVVVRIEDREILDVIQFFEKSFTESEKYSRLYPGSITFFNSAGDFRSVEELQAKIEWCFREKGSTYVQGHGLQKKKADPVGTDNDRAAPGRV